MLITTRQITAVCALALLVHAPEARAQRTDQAPATARPLQTALADLAFDATRLEISGVTVYRASELLHYAMALASTDDAPPTTQRMARLIEQIYREDGYALAEVMAHVDAANAAVRWHVSEGRIVQVTVRGADASTTQRIDGYLKPLPLDLPLRQQVLERALALSSDLGGIGVQSRIDPVPG
jgi:hemolysin activation/secretion protein